jgi:hypothetical protein
MTFVSSILNLRTIYRRLCSFVWIIAITFNFLPSLSGQAADSRLAEVKTPSATVIYVNHAASGDNNGSTWADAFTQIQPALNAAGAGKEIWVAQGVYTPTLRTDPMDPRSVAFTLVNDVAMYGGFSGVGSETSLDERDLENYATILDADLNGDDVGFSNNTENSYHVIVGNSTHTRSTRLDGFVIRGGNADGSGGSTSQGGGIYNDGGNPTLANLVVQNNLAEFGGGFYNRAEIDNQNIGNPLLIDVKFIGNDANYGGGMHNIYGAPALYGVHFLGNDAEVNGGGFRSQQGDPIFMNCVFSDNEAGDRGGGIHNSISDAFITNTTFYKNTASDGGSGIYNQQSNLEINNSIFWDNGLDPVVDGTGSVSTIHQSLIEGGCPLEGEESCTGAILTSNPNFRDPDGLDDNPETADYDLRLKHSSQAIDAGDNSKVLLDEDDLDEDSNTTERIPYDADQRPRFVNIPFVTDYGIGTPPVVDLGAYETRVIYVDDDTSGSDNGTSWGDAYRNLNNALEIAVYGDDVWVARGTYKPEHRMDPNDARSVTFLVPRGVKVYGHFGGSETSPTQRTFYQFSESVLSGDLNGNDNGFENNEENAYSVVTIQYADEVTVLDGFLIRNGNADECTNCFFPFYRFQFPQVEQDYDSGGGLLNKLGSPYLVNLTFFENYAIQGGGVYTDFGDPKFINCSWFGNRANFGAGIRNHNSNSKIWNAVFSGNTAQNGGAMYNSYSSPEVKNVTFTNNNAVQDVPGGDGVLNDLNSSFSVTNSIFWNNGSDQIVNSTADDSADVRYSIIQDGCPDRTSCDAVKFLDPAFIDANGTDNQIGTLDDDLQLGGSSPGIDAAENSSVEADLMDLDGDGNTSEQLPLDLLYSNRFYDVDTVSDTGAGTAPIVDMGAYEAQDHGYGYLPMILK